MKQRLNKLTWIFILSFLLLTSTEAFSQDVGDAAPDFTLNTLEGASFTLSDYNGKVVFIYLFGYACPHCLANGNNTETEIYDKFKSNGGFVAVGVDTWNGNESGVQSFKSSTGITYTLCLNGSELESKYATTYDRIILVDKDGIIRFKSTQNAIKDEVTLAAGKIDTLLNDSGATGRGPDQAATDRALEIYPVPAREMIHIRYTWTDPGDMMISVINSSGKVMLYGTANSFHSADGLIEIPCGQLKGGIYFVQVRSKEQMITRKITVAK